MIIMIGYYTFKAESVTSALIAIDEIIDNFDDRYSNSFTGYNIHVIRLLLQSDYDCPEDIVESAVQIAADQGLFEYEKSVWELI